eukprot:CAMPEP_0114233242 /NCGR_PEP_ID=MMETSP0058-20121206/5051_1 /TAXON_ID=36894 /ORGANISM="Pyramimonas parkeae, CCMP726" /LENGTH=291 /DNA_ID=CAMNT_0001344801 /DNA_START=276 /DNA_END=1151 /DNA_ORIENTATION=-
MRKSSMCHFAEEHALQALKTVRPEKLDKKCVAVTALQKCGSTLLCYVAALVNTENRITNFRNDFDIMPMLSFPQSLIHQNFNYRQDGKYQMFKINGRFEVMEQGAGMKHHYEHIWMCRGINGYFCSIYWWVISFYPKIKDSFKCFTWVTFDVFKDMFYKMIATEHINDCHYVYTRLKAGQKFLYVTTYEVLVKNKRAEVQKLAKALDIKLSAGQIDDICEKTSKRSMAEYDRFDPVHFGDGDGLSKINLKAHNHALNAADLQWYQEQFEQKFAGTGIKTYEDFSQFISAFQ